jgi:hypothetical protein
VLPGVTDAVWSSQDTQKDPPFIVSGAPVIAPRSIPFQTVPYMIGLDGLQKPLTRQITVDTQGLIIDPSLNAGTTLRITNENEIFSLRFIAFHKGLWSDTPQVSLFFSGTRDGRTDFAHICIPVIYTTTNENTNQFLNSWLCNDPVPAGLTLNSILDTNGSKLNVLYYCLGGKDSWNSYNLFLNTEPLYVNQNRLPSWIMNDKTFTGSQWLSKNMYRLKTFSDYYTVAMNVRSRDYDFLNWGSISITSDTKTFTSILDTKPQTGITPTYYNLPQGALSGTSFKKSAKRTLVKKQIKCYPINLMKDVDKNGNVVIDQNNVPMSTAEASEQGKEVTLDPVAVNAQNSTAILVFTIIFGIVAVLLTLGLVFYVFTSKAVPSELPLPESLPAPPMAALSAAALPLPPLPPPPRASFPPTQA